MMSLLRSVWQAPRRLLLLAVAGVLLVQLALVVQSASARGFGSSDAGVKLWQVQSTARTGRLDTPIDYRGAIYDPDHKYSPFVPPWFFWQDNEPYSEYSSPFIWASAPLYAWFGHVGLLLMPWLAGALLVMMGAWLAWRVQPNRWAALAPIVVGFSSPVLIYSLEFWEHTAGAGLATFAVLALVRAVDSSRRAAWLIAAGAASGLGLTMRAELYVFPVALAIGLLLLRSRLPLLRSISLIAIGGLLTAGPWWVYQALRWGSPLGPRLSQNVPALGGSAMLDRLGDTTGRNWTMFWPSAGVGLDWLMALGGGLLMVTLAWVVLRRTRFNSIIFKAQISLLIVMAGLLAWRIATWQMETGQRPDDLLTTFPIALLLVLVLPRPDQSVSCETASPRAPHVARALLGVALSFMLLVLIASPFQGGVQWGPRFLLPGIVPLTVGVIAYLARSWRSFDRPRRAGLGVALIVLLVVGGYSTWNGVRFIHDGQAGNVALQNLIAAAPEQVVVTDAWFIPQGAPYSFENKIWLMAENEEDMFALIQLLRKTTNEPGILYISSLTWAHIDPQILMGPRIALNGEPRVFDWPGTYLQVSRYLLLK
ncbi:MAG TPA: hypothetical protein VFF59_09070 [Anaerolineae bacterium]|nr:hypothetical protein [Anaerolineae bacterium]